jgi:predicted permease
MPDWKEEIHKRLRGTRVEPAMPDEVIQEFAEHLEDRYREMLAGGVDEDAARAALVGEIENVDQVRRGLPPSKRERDSAVASLPLSTGSLLSDFARDLQYGWRTMRRSPTFIVFAVLSLGLGIGANTTVFTIVNTLLLHPLPGGDPAHVVVLSDVTPKGAGLQNGSSPVSYANFRDYAARQACFRTAAAFTWPQILTLQEKGGPQRMFGELVTQPYFSTLGLQPALGRFFVSAEVSEPGSAPVAVLSYGAWQARFGGGRDVLGRTLELNNVDFTVIGVAPKGFLGLSVLFGPDVWLPATMAERVFPGEFRSAWSDRSKAMFYGVARLLGGTSMQQAQANLDTVGAGLAREYPETNAGHGIRVGPITDQLYFGAGGTGGLTLATTVLFAIVMLVLGIACSNVANLLLARATGRRQEMGVRLAIGAQRGRLVRQLLAESTLLSLISCAAGLAFGFVGCRYVWSFVPADVVHNMVAPRLDPTVLVFAVVLSLLTALLFGLAPALNASRTDVVTALKEESAAAGRGRRSIRFTQVLLAGQVAFSLLCLITAALFFRSIKRAYSIDPGFQTEHLAMVVMNATQAGYDPPRVKEFYRAARERIAGVPGVASVAWGSGLPFWNSASHPVELEGAESRTKSEAIGAVVIIVGTNYFATLGVPVVAGRGFSDSDREESRPAAIINQALAAQRWPGGDPIGESFRFAGEKTLRVVVGIARNANYSTLGESPQPCVYLPQRQNYAGGMTLYVRSEGNPSGLLVPLQQEIRSLDRNIEISDVRTGAKLIGQVLWGPHVGVSLLGVFGSLALVLATVGLYGVMAFSVARRRREIGVRMALGAPRAAVQRLIVFEGMKVVICGIVVGLAGVMLVGRVLSRMLFGISSADPLSLAAGCLSLTAVALASCYFPARSATRIDPITVLREG